jgi:hypothetical protein
MAESSHDKSRSSHDESSVNRCGKNHIRYASSGEVSASRAFIVIPARLASTRLPRKLLLAETGKPLIQHTYEGASRAARPLGVVVATDHQDIVDAVLGVRN